MNKKTILAIGIFTIALQSICISEQCQVIDTQAEPAKKPLRYEGRKNIDKEIPLQEALDNFNPYFPAPELTVDEVIAAIRAIKNKHPSIPDDVLAIYNRVADEKLLPKGMDFSSIEGWGPIDGYDLTVDWRDLSLDSNHSGTEKGFNYRIRARYISAHKLSAEEIAHREKMNDEKNMTIFGRKLSTNDLSKPEVQKWIQEQKDKKNNN